ncbi:MAG: hypothetical protein IKX17_01035, partial [Prevotella sp.]|nr:hypothetical protein [Prevotella sp.]
MMALKNPINVDLSDFFHFLLLFHIKFYIKILQFEKKRVSLQKEKMKYDLFESVSQGILGTQDEENRRILAIAHELRGSCHLYEVQFRDGKGNVNDIDVEQHCAEQYAKEHGCWIPIEHLSDLGEPGPCGNENDTYVSNDIIYKVNNLLNCGNILGLL